MLKLEKINKKVGAFSLHDIDLSVDKGDYFMLIGETGAGKSMLLDIITGLLIPDSGNIILDGKNLQNIPPQKRNIGIVYQKPTLFPHMSVFENIAYPLKIKKISSKEIIIKVNELAGEIDITHLLKRNITNLFGGEAQRVTIARTLATDPAILLLDEPLSFLDVQLKREMSALLRKINLKGKTIIHVTHDYEEALALANRVGIIENGTLIQTGTPHDVFNNPKSAFIANFVGIKNFLHGKLNISESASELKVFESSGIKIFTSSNEEDYIEGYIIIPSEAITLSEERLQSSAINNFDGIIKDIFQTKLGIEVIIDIGSEISANITHQSLDRLHLAVGKAIWVSFKASSVMFVPGSFGQSDLGM